MNVFRKATDAIGNALRTMPERRMLLILGFVTGLASGLGAVILKISISTIQKWLASAVRLPYNLSSLFLPGIGLLLSMLFVKYVVKDDISHGVTKVLYALSRHESQIKHHNIWSSVAASALTIGFGGSVGAEAPIVYAGAAIGSNLGRDFNLPYKDITILLGCGAGGAIAGIFKAPLAGVAFTLEILMFNISMTSILPLLVSCITATVVSLLLLGEKVVFTNSIQSFTMSNIPWYILLGLFCAAISLYFLRTTLYMEDKIKAIRKPYVRWLVCAAGLGILIFLFPPLFGEGYGDITHLLNNEAEIVMSKSVFMRHVTAQWAVILFFAAVLVFKVISMCLTNAGGGVGGTFGPTLVVGGIAGFLLARILNVCGVTNIPEANLVLVGMGGLMAGVMQAPMTSIFLIAEITGGYDLLLPLIITSCISFATMRAVEPYSIYAKRLAKHGDLLTHDSDQAVLTLLKTMDFIENDFVPVLSGQNLGNLVGIVTRSHRNLFPVIDTHGVFLGVIYMDDIREIMFNRDLYDKITVDKLMKPCKTFVMKDEPMESVMEKFEKTKAWNLPVLDSDGHYLGFVSRSQIISSYRSQLKQVSHD
ncbi:MAG: chloride channel protein [Bacteroidales bacterium]|nr:chloride channel protein [Bacteroidales bacterium]MCI2121204.1 chloride channel protein [Bacteroidales bacterium]MCI2146006.1 chloride channel protein [Bacteroidales bacterium]